VARGGVAESDVTFVRAGGTNLRYRDIVAGKHDATLLRTPFELLARERGLNVLATAESLGAYQGTVARCAEAGRSTTRPPDRFHSRVPTGRGVGPRSANRESRRRFWSPIFAT
jgi:hypothetical protein